MNNGITLSSLLNQTFSELGDAGRLLAVFLAIIVPVNTAAEFFQDGNSNPYSFGFSLQFTESLLAQGALVVALVVIAFIVDIVLSYWLYAGMTKRTASPGFERFLPWLGIYILSTLGIIAGFVLLIIPGIIIAIRWTAVLPVVIEGRVPALDAFGESWRMTGGKSWSIFFAFLILLIGAMIGGGVLGGIAGVLTGENSILVAFVTALVEALVSAVFIAFGVGTFRLANNDTEEIAEVFA